MPVDREALQARLRALFIDEIADNVVVLNRGLVALEQQGAAIGTDTVVNEMFRAAHSLKGGAHSAGVDELVDLCHHLEDVLSRLRDETLPSTTRVVGPLLEAVDALDAAGRRMREGGEAAGADLGRARRGLVALVGTPVAPATTVQETATQADPDGSAALATAPGAGAADEPVGLAAARRDESVRVPAERLDALLNQAGELLHACQRVDALGQGLVEASAAATRRAARSAGSVATVDGSSTSSSDDIRAWRMMADRLDGLARGAVDANQLLTALGRGVADSVRHARMMPLTHAYDGLERVVRDLARAGGKEVRLELRGWQVEVDRPILDAVADAVLHLVRNAVDHGIEAPVERVAAGKPPSGCVTVEATLVQEGVSVTVADDGRGIDRDALRAAARRRGISTPEDESMLAEVAFVPGVSTSPLITEVSGRGVGLDAVRTRVEAVGGSVRLQSTPDGGCTATLRLPLALSAIRVLLVGAAGEVLALPSSGVSRLLRVEAADLRPLGDRDAILLDTGPAPVLWLSDVLGFADPGPVSPPFTAILTGTPPNVATLVVDELISEEEVVMKPLGEGPAAVPGVLGATILSSGRVALVLNPATCVRNGLVRSGPSSVLASGGPDHPTRRPRILLAEDTITTRALERSILEAAGYEVLVAVDGVEAWQLLEEHGADVVVSDVDMPRMDGVELCEAARRSSRFRDVPFVLVTSLASEIDRRRGIDAGANAYLVKADFDQAILLDTLERLL